jgi:hypothetical protein
VSGDRHLVARSYQVAGNGFCSGGARC